MSDAPELPPPRYEQVGNWQHLICDEQEWLARPASWGISKLPSEQRTRKQNIFDVRYYGWLAGFVECDECREWVQRTFADESIGFDVAALEEWNLQTPHPECAARPFRRAARNWQRGICGEAEVLYEFSDELCNRYHILTLVARDADTSFQHYDTVALALELVGPNPFRPVVFDPAWRTDSAVALARQMYESRDFGAMPILADALQDAGCDNEPILNHCRDPHAAHVRGCWVCDLVLGL